MKWFKRWYRAKFENHSKFNAEKKQSLQAINEINETISMDGNIKLDNNNDHCKKRKTIETIRATNTITPTPSVISFSSYASSYSLSSIASSSFTNTDTTAITKTATAKTISSSSYPSVNNNNNIQLPSTSKQSSLLLDKKNNSNLIKNIQSQVKQCYDSNGSTNVNANGNGENCGGAVQKSKETRRRKIIVVRRNCSRGTEEQAEKTVKNIPVKNAKGNINNHLKQLSSPGQKALWKRARELENFISDKSDKLKDCEDTIEQDDSEYFEDGEDSSQLQYQSNERRLSDWVVVSVDLERTSSADSQLTEQQLTNRIGGHYYTTSEISHTDENSTIVTLHCSPSTLNLHSNQEEDYGLFHSRNRILRRLLWFFKFLDFDIKTGCISTDELNDNNQTDQLNNIESEVSNTNSLPLNLSLANQNQPSCSNAKMGGKNIEMMPSPMLVTPDSSISSSSLRSSDMNDRAISLDEYYGLNDCGDIIVHMDHVKEEKGFSYVSRRSKPMCKKVKCGKEMREKKFRVAYTLKCFFRQLIDRICYKCSK